jgi:L-seryl-tRNA(Ser) seleniumtransferase
MDNPLRNLPSVNELLENPKLKKLVENVSHNAVADGVRGVLDDLRTRLREMAATEIKVPTPSELAEHVAHWVQTKEQQSLRPVINATGVMLHTGLGRAPLSKEALNAVVATASGYASVEVEIATGKRSQRTLVIEALLRELTGAEAAVVVNNNAAATLLTLTALGFGKEVILSRSELIEIGGSFRLPDVMTSAGATLREVGTTNKTRIGDYEAAINEQTAALMRAHSSNFKIVGFTEKASLEELVQLGRKHELPVIDDVGSGALVDFARYGLHDEPNIIDSIKAGADLVLFSGDKLLGGPQAGIVVGKKRWVQKLAKHPMMRALRVDKMTLAALAETLKLYRKLDQAELRIPLLAMLSTPLQNLKLRAERLAPQLAATSLIATAEPVEDHAMLGGGSIPTQQVPTWCVAVTAASGTIDQLSEKLRKSEPSIFGRVSNDRLLLDLRTILPGQELEIVDICKGLSSEKLDQE